MPLLATLKGTIFELILPLEYFNDLQLLMLLIVSL